MTCHRLLIGIEDMKTIPLTQGKFAIVDDDMYEYLNQWKWRAWKNGNIYYAIRRIRISKTKYRQVNMAAEVVAVPAGYLLDHKDRNGCNNCQANLQVCSKSENGQNRAKHPNCSSQYKGVAWHKRLKKWMVSIRLKSKRTYLGYFENEDEAAHVYDKVAKELFGEFARTNF